jgi:hypothetical protein
MTFVNSINRVSKRCFMFAKNHMSISNVQVLFLFGSIPYLLDLARFFNYVQTFFYAVFLPGKKSYTNLYVGYGHMAKKSMPIVESNSKNAIASRAIHTKRARLPSKTNFLGKKIGRPSFGSAINAYCREMM